MGLIWELCSDPDRYVCVQQADLRYFHDRFIGQPMIDSWQTPAFEILNRSKKVADFTSWQVGSRAILVSARARSAILAICSDNVEFLPFATIKKVDLFALNVVRLAEVIDWHRSRIQGDYLVEKVVFGETVAEPPSIFKDPRLTGWTFVTDVFGEAAAAARLTGLRLADPAKNRFEQIVQGHPTNEFKGL